MNKIRLAPAVLNDLKEINLYISDELANPAAAASTLQSIISSYEKLKDFPLLGPSLTQKVKLPTDFRYLLSGNYLIFYKTENEYVSIYRILYAGSGYLKQLFQ